MNEKRRKKLVPEAVKDFLSQRMQNPANIVVAAVGIGHDQLLRVVDKALGWLPTTASNKGTVDMAAQYTGGEARLDGDGLAQIAVACEAVSWSDPDLIPVAVLNTLLGGGGSFSAGGPGKGMYSRLYTSVLNQHPWVQSCTGFNHCYTDSVQNPDRLPELAEIICEEISKMGQVTRTELARAKNQTKASVFMNLESGTVTCEDLGRQILTAGQYVEPATLYTAIEKVTEKDVFRVAARLLRSRPTVVLYGEMYGAPSYEQISEAAGMKALQSGTA
ncbi:Mitochondrial-processing peptidase subunit alpha [Cyanidiococcus yangmingshanensis]|uniref:Mitochondrial-processing peptidase subunit alpha n=1 Tax=Cyanidiococcus yangmingshanensis TaxID=2690220 RepID=A0A7J7IIP4_9RHOD|nr:Mitochondrial-processing peptidase subunit alpha [Cyanidiococcus yangmingshanensis]